MREPSKKNEKSPKWAGHGEWKAGERAQCIEGVRRKRRRENISVRQAKFIGCCVLTYRHGVNPIRIVMFANDLRATIKRAKIDRLRYRRYFAELVKGFKK